MKQFYSHYENWEDFKNGMYCATVTRDNEQVNKAKSVLSNPRLFEVILEKVLIDWPIASMVNLTNEGMNRRAWLGAAACNFEHGVTEINTRFAWGELNDLQRSQANDIAEIIIKKYERKNSEIHRRLGEKMLF